MWVALVWDDFAGQHQVLGLDNTGAPITTQAAVKEALKPMINNMVAEGFRTTWRNGYCLITHPEIHGPLRIYVRELDKFPSR